MDEILTVREVAAWLKVHPSSVYRLLKKRRLPAFRVGSDWRISRRDVELWIEQITVMGRPDPGRAPPRSEGVALRRR